MEALQQEQKTSHNLRNTLLALSGVLTLIGVACATDGETAINLGNVLKDSTPFTTPFSNVHVGEAVCKGITFVGTETTQVFNAGVLKDALVGIFDNGLETFKVSKDGSLRCEDGTIAIIKSLMNNGKQMVSGILQMY